ncbi:zinc finger CCCH domain-containing protein 7B-like isoform X2 [Antennarius striatus]|uniref:zinc finger CCCH domain-containing protein 7B-like isoform X2 n=1 Tax=Antennarius striatus TaxID=241820 RepID=UPI0035B0F660
MDPARQRRGQQIQQSLEFIRSSLPYPDPEGYQGFLTQLVCNLLDEGNALFKEKEWLQAVGQFTEGLSVSSYASEDDLHISEVLLESLYINRAAAYHSMGEYHQAVQDCERALELCSESRRALYRKALCLKDLGMYKEAYDCTTQCLLICRMDKQVNELAQELAFHLGLKYRKPYVGTKEQTLITTDVTNINTTAEAIKLPDHLGEGTIPLSDLALGVVKIQTALSAAPAGIPQSSIPFTDLVSSSVPDLVAVCDELELMGDDIDSLLDCFPAELESAETHIQPAFSVSSTASTCTPVAPPVLPPPTPQLPPAFFNSSVGHINALDFFSDAGQSSTTALLDCLDDISNSRSGGTRGGPNLVFGSLELDTLDGLDALDDFSDMPSSAADGSAKYESKPQLDTGEKCRHLLNGLDLLETVPHLDGINAEASVEQLDSLDALDSFPSAGDVVALLESSMEKKGLDSLDDFSSTGTTGSHSNTAPKNNVKEKNNQGHVAVANPLSSTHEFLQACSTCFPQKGKGIYSFTHKPDLVHSCKRDILLCRRKIGHPSEWTRVRPIPKRTSFNGPFVLCNEIVNSGDLGLCKYGEDCTFAYNRLEIDVWTEERKGTLDRNLLFETAAVKLDPVISIIRLIQEHKGLFLFLCQECFDHKPRIISERCKVRHTICSNLDARHNFDANKCLAFMVKTPSTKYSKVRPLRLLCNFDLCHQAVRFGCQREDSCCYAHSVIELKTWRVQRDTGINPDEIVNVSIKYYENEEQPSGKHKRNRPGSGGGGSKPKGVEGVSKRLNMKMKFVCAQCWQDGRNSEPDKILQYCSAKARHKWTKDRWLLLVESLKNNKWVPVRPLPHVKNFPAHYDICFQILEKKKCNYTGKCTFAHSQEEKEMWTYMKNNNLVEMQQVYDMWLTSRTHNRPADGAALNQPAPEEVQKEIIMPTDNAEPTSGFYCHLCGKHSNSERQWQKHISTEKHKDRLFNCQGEEEALTWSYRFPGWFFKLCPRSDGGCPDGVSCDFAHCPEELDEWIQRRDFLRQKLAKAREDMLVMPEEVNFGKYNFLLHD